MTYGEMSTRILASYDDGRRNTRFLLKQLVGESKKAVEHSAHANRLCSQQQQEITQLKQAMSSMRIKYDQSIADLQHRLQASLGGIQELQHQNAALKKQTHQFRELYAGGGVPGTGSTSRVPGSSHSSNSGGGQHGLGTERLTGSPYAPPMPGYVRNKQELERAKERENEERSRSHGPLLRGEREGASRLSSSDLDSVITPIVVPPPHHHIASNNGSHHRHRITSPRRDTMVGNVPQSPRVRDVGNIPQSPRVRDLSGGSGYMFTSRSSNNSRDLQSSGIKRHRPESTSVSPGYQNSFSFSSRGNASIPSSSPFGRR